MKRKNSALRNATSTADRTEGKLESAPGYNDSDDGDDDDSGREKKKQQLQQSSASSAHSEEKDANANAESYFDRVVKEAGSEEMEMKRKEMKVAMAENFFEMMKANILRRVEPHWKLEWKRKVIEMAQGMSTTVLLQCNIIHFNKQLIHLNLKLEIHYSFFHDPAKIMANGVELLFLQKNKSGTVSAKPEPTYKDFNRLRKYLGHKIIPFNVWWWAVGYPMVSSFYSVPLYSDDYEFLAKLRKTNQVYVPAQHFNKELLSQCVEPDELAQLMPGEWLPAPTSESSDWCMGGRFNFRSHVKNWDSFLPCVAYQERIVNHLFRYDRRKCEVAINLIPRFNKHFWKSGTTSSDGCSFGLPAERKEKEENTTTKVLNYHHLKWVNNTVGFGSGDADGSNILPIVSREDVEMNQEIPKNLIIEMNDETVCLVDYFTPTELVRLLEWLASIRIWNSYVCDHLSEDFPTPNDHFADFDNPDSIKGELAALPFLNEIKDYQAILSELNTILSAPRAPSTSTAPSTPTEFSLSSAEAVDDYKSPLIPSAVTNIVGHYLPFYSRRPTPPDWKLKNDKE